jgi:hypothetical protein
MGLMPKRYFCEAIDIELQWLYGDKKFARNAYRSA